MSIVYIALGSNLNMPIQQLKLAIQTMADLPDTEIKKVSSLYQSQPLGPQDQPDYVNAVACLETGLSPLALLDALQNIENEQGRIRLRRWGERTLDLDILLYDNQIIHNEHLTVHHHDMQNREFVIVPLYEISPELILPDGVSLQQLVKRFSSHQMAILD